jgi:hypothetical protein
MKRSKGAGGSKIVCQVRCAEVSEGGTVWCSGAELLVRLKPRARVRLMAVELPLCSPVAVSGAFMMLYVMCSSLLPHCAEMACSAEPAATCCPIAASATPSAVVCMACMNSTDARLRRVRRRMHSLVSLRLQSMRPSSDVSAGVGTAHSAVRGRRVPLRLTPASLDASSEVMRTTSSGEIGTLAADARPEAISAAAVERKSACEPPLPLARRLRRASAFFSRP